MLRTLGLAVATLLGTFTSPAPLGEPLVHTRLPAAVGAQLAVYAGRGLSLGECKGRLYALGSRLKEAGYRNLGRRLGADGVEISLWYHPARKMTVVATFSTNAVGNLMEVGEVPGRLRWNELMGPP